MATVGVKGLSNQQIYRPDGMSRYPSQQ